VGNSSAEVSCCFENAGSRTKVDKHRKSPDKEQMNLGSYLFPFVSYLLTLGSYLNSFLLYRTRKGSYLFWFRAYLIGLGSYLTQLGSYLFSFRAYLTKKGKQQSGKPFVGTWPAMSAWRFARQGHDVPCGVSRRTWRAMFGQPTF